MTTPAPAPPAGTLLSKVTTGRITKPHLLIIYGPHGVGKSTFAADAPAPIFLGAEDGANNLNVSRLPQTKSLDVVMRGLSELLHEAHPFKTLVGDSLDWMEGLVYEAVCVDKKVKSIEDIPYGKGYAYALEKWREMMQALTRLREEKGMNIILIAHAKIKKFEDPSTPAGYERYQLKLQTGAATDASALWREYVDTVLFANYVTITSDADKKRGFGDGTRMIYTQRRPGFDAKNRLGLPFELPLSWQDFEEAAAKGEPNSAGALLEQIEGLKAQIKQKDLLPKIETAIKAATGNVTQLAQIKNRLEALLGAQG